MSRPDFYAQPILSISSHVIRGGVGNRVTNFVLEHMHFPVWYMPTVLLTWHAGQNTGQGPAHRAIISDDDFDGFTRDIIARNKNMPLQTVLSGYFAAVDQVMQTAQLIAELKSQNPDLLYLCDPIMADEDGLYIDAEIAAAIKHHLVPIADILTPNISELEWICDRQLITNTHIIDAARTLPAKECLVTSAWSLLRNTTANLLVTAQTALLAEHRQIDDPVSGLGDLTAALYLGHRLHGDESQLALQKTTASVFDILSHTMRAGGDDLMLEQFGHFLNQPMARVQMRYISDERALNRK